jgi:predicted small secreted protein
MAGLKNARKLGHQAAKPFGGPPMRKIIVLAAVAAALMTSACNTVAGIGRDAQAAGAAVTGAANDMKR